MPQYIYKIATKTQWEDAIKKGVFEGAPIDLSDGYIHFSTANQARETAAKHFHGQTNLKLVTVPTNVLGDALKWETSRGGDLFPHLYAKLKTADAVSVLDLPEDETGGHIFPEEL
jgi:uncharacterized protein (DUF952 family)